MQIGDVVAGRFELRAVAGHGGMGVVYRAWDRDLGVEVALKAMLRAGASEKLRFGRESRVLRGLTHPGIVRHVADGVTAEGELWLAMEWLEGEDLGARLARGPLSGAEALAVGRGIAEALAHAHAHGLVHRDLKPSNVWLLGGVPAREHTKLLDFGAVRRIEPAASLFHTREGAMIGTPGYLAPEQARGDTDVDASADLYALGCVLFECLSGRPAFEGTQALALLAKVLLEAPPPLRSLVAVPDALDELVARMLAKERAERPPGALAIADALAAIDPFEVRPAAPPPPRSLLREQPWWCVLLVPSPPVSPEDATMGGDDPEAESLARTASESGARVVALAGGAQVLLWESSGAPADLAARGARAALAIRAATRRAVSLVSGRVAVDGAFPVGEALERAAASVKRAGAEIVLDESIANLLGESFDVTRIDGTPVLTGARTGAIEAPAKPGQDTPCVGRDVELSTLSAMLAEVREERSAAAVLLTGEMGAGKSRVRREWIRSVTAGSGTRAWQAHADVMHERAAYAIAARLVRDGCGVPFGAAPGEVRARIAETVERTVPAQDRQRIASRLSELCGAPWEQDLDPGLKTARQDPTVMGDQLRAAWEDFLVASCAEAPLVLVIENLQWADASSLALIDRTLRNFGDRRWMVLGVARPEHRVVHPRLWSERGVREVALGPLKDRAAERLVRARLGAESRPERVRALVARAAGNPYFLEELARAEAEGHGEETPDTILAMVEARLLRIDPALRRVLRAASVYGANFDARGVSAVLGEPLASGMIEALVESEWLVMLEGGGHTFRQATSREAAYAMLLDEDKRTAHARAAEWLAEGRADPVAIAEHLERAGAPERAGPWWARAATQALEAHDLRGCVARAEAAERCGASGWALGEALRARAEAHSWLDETRALLDAAARLRALAASAPEHEAPALLWEALGALRSGDAARVERVLARARDLVQERPESDAAVFYGLRIASVAVSAGRVASSDAFVAELHAGVPPLAERGPRILGAETRWQAARAHHAHDLERSSLLRQQASSLLRSAGDLRTAASEEGTRGYELVLLGAHEEALQVLTAALAECRRLGLAFSVAGMRHNLGLALLGLGRLDEALTEEQAAVEFFALGGNRAMECASRDYAARILVAAGRADDAVREMERGLSLLADGHPFALTGLATLADALTARGGPGDAARALAYVRRSYAALRADPAQFEEPCHPLRVHLDALRACGLDEEARHAAEEARAWVRGRAAQIQSDAYRSAFLRDALDVARILSAP